MVRTAYDSDPEVRERSGAAESARRAAPPTGRACVQVAVDGPGDVLNRPDPICHGRVVLGQNDDHVAAATTGEAADAVDTPAVGGAGQPAVLHVHYHPGGRPGRDAPSLRGDDAGHQSERVPA